MGAAQNIAQLGSSASFLESKEKTSADCQSSGFAHDDKLEGEPGALNALHSHKPGLGIGNRLPPCVRQQYSHFFVRIYIQERRQVRLDDEPNKQALGFNWIWSDQRHETFF